MLLRFLDLKRLQSAELGSSCVKQSHNPHSLGHFRLNLIREFSAFPVVQSKMTPSRHLNLVPPLVQSGRVDELLQLGQTLASSLSPSNNSLAVFPTNMVRLLFCVCRPDFIWLFSHLGYSNSKSRLSGRATCVFR
jgi:hypothetical protein